MAPQAVEFVSLDLVEDYLVWAFQDAGFSVEKLLPLFQVPHRKLRNPSKETISGLIFNVLNTISSYLGLTCEAGRSLPLVGTPLFSPANPTYDSIAPDYCICDQRHTPVCVVNIKPPPLFAGDRRPTSDYSFMENCLPYGDTSNIMIELQMGMIAACRRFGMVCDGHYLVLVEFVDNCFYYQQNYLHLSPSGEAKISLEPSEDFCIPFTFLAVTVDSTGPSFLESLIYFLYRASQAGPLTPDSPVYQYLRLAVQPRNSPCLIRGVPSTVALESSRAVPIFASEATEKDEILYKTLLGDIGATRIELPNTSTSFKLQAKHLKDVIEQDIDDEEYVVMKIYEEHMEEAYFQEWDAITLLEQDLAFNSIYLIHQKVKIQFFWGYAKPITGYAIISKFMGSHPIPRARQTFELFVYQAVIINEAGVGGLYFGAGNVIFSDGKIYLHDFSRSKVRSDLEPGEWLSILAKDRCRLNDYFKLFDLTE